MFRAGGLEHLRCVGETEFVNGVAAMSASGEYRGSFGEIRACAGIVGMADCLRGAAVGEVLDAHLAASARFRGIRHAAGWDRTPAVRSSHTNPPKDSTAARTSRRVSMSPRRAGCPSRPGSSTTSCRW